MRYCYITEEREYKKFVRLDNDDDEDVLNAIRDIVGPLYESYGIFTVSAPAIPIIGWLFASAPAPRDVDSRMSFQLSRKLPASVVAAIAEGSLEFRQMFGFGAHRQGEIDNYDIRVEAKAIGRFFNDSAFTIEMTRSHGFTFPPNHPKLGDIYIEHPLANLEGSGKSGVFLPTGSFDEILYQERERELAELLVELGAIEIDRFSSVDQEAEDQMSIALSGAVGKRGAIKAGSDSESKSASKASSKNSRKLEGAIWREGQRIDRSKYAWLKFEPQWEELVTAREVGGLIEAEVTLNSLTAFSSNLRSFADIELKIAKFSASGKVDRASSSSVKGSQTLSVKFSPIKRS